MELKVSRRGQHERGAWMIYGAYGFTGRLIVAEAMRRGHRPVLAGRDAPRLESLAREFGLTTRQLALDAPRPLAEALGSVRLVLNAAGPFGETAPPLIEACLEAGANYVDISGEVHHVRAVGGLDARAKAAGIALLTGAGFGVTFGECLAHHILARLPDATHLRLSVAADNAQTTLAVRRTILDVLARGGFAVESGRWTPRPLAHQTWSLDIDGASPFAAAPMGELAALSRSTTVPYIMVGRPMPLKAAARIRRLSPVVRAVLSARPLRRMLGRGWSRSAASPAVAPVSAPTGAPRRSLIWAEARNGRGERAAARLETGEGYQASAEAALVNVEALIARPIAGAFTPGLAFGPQLLSSLGAVVTDLDVGASQ